MKRRLYPNMKHMTTMFCVAIVFMTVCTLMLRLTVFSEMAVYASADGRPVSDTSVDDSDLFPYSINRNIRFRSADGDGNILIENPDTNEFLMTVNIMLPDTQETLISTGLIEPGQSRDKASLNVSLDDGTYDCVAEVTAYDPETLDVRGKEQRQVTIQVG